MCTMTQLKYVNNFKVKITLFYYSSWHVFPQMFHVLWNILFLELSVAELFIYFYISADVPRFDNTYSILQSKKISFTMDVVLPEIPTQNLEEKAWLESTSRSQYETRSLSSND